MDVLSLCQMLSILVCVVWGWLRNFRGAVYPLIGVILVNVFIGGFAMRMDSEGVTWHQIFAGQVRDDTLTTLFFSGCTYVGLIAIFTLFVGVQIGRVLVATSERKSTS